MIDTQKPLLKLEEVAKHLGIKPDTLRRWLRSGYVPGLKISSSWRVKVENLEKFIEFREAETKKKIQEGRI